MRTTHLANMMLVAGAIGLAMGCGNSTTGDATGGTPSTGGGSGGEAAGGTTSESGGTEGSGGVGAGGTSETGGSPEAGGAVGTGGRVRGTGGSSTEDSGGTVGAGGDNAGGRTGVIGGAEMGGRTGSVGRGGRTGAAGASGAGGRTTPTTGTGTCTASKDTGRSVSGSGPHKVVIETNSDPGIKCGTIFRPADLGGDEKYPIFVWGEGGCSQNGLSNQAAMGEIASWGYFIVADGVPSGTACASSQDGKPFLDYITWAIAENGKSCSAYYDSLDTTKIASDGFSCGGLMSEGISADPRLTAVGITSSGQFNSNTAMYSKMHAPFKVMNGGSSDMAYENGLRDYEAISKLGIPSLYFSKTSAGHGGDLNNGKGDFNTVNLAWLNWQLKGDEGEKGKALLVGPNCKFCKASGWDFRSANID